jgi:hypothetical protein
VTAPTAFTDGVALVELAPLTEPLLVAQAVASAVGVREQPGVSLLVTLSEALGSLRMLLVLDSCEHLVGPCAELAERLLRACPDLRIWPPAWSRCESPVSRPGLCPRCLSPIPKTFRPLSDWRNLTASGCSSSAPAR